MAQNQFSLLGQRRFLPFFVTQFFGAFNDNVYRQAIIALLFVMGLSTAERGTYATLAPAIFILPYFLFSGYAGQLADKLEKSRLIRITTTMEIAIMSAAAIGFYLHSLPLLMLCLFATGVQSTLFGPVKYSVLPGVLRKDELVGGNGLVEMGTTVAILLGMLAGGAIFRLAGAHGELVAGLSVIALAVLGNAVSRFIPPVAPGDPHLQFNWNPLPESRKALALTRTTAAQRYAVLGISWFWFFGTVITSQLPTFAEVSLGGDERLYLLILALFSVGTGIGSLLCERLSSHRIDSRLVLWGALGMSLFLLDLVRRTWTPLGSHDIGIMEFVRDASHWALIADVVLIGAFTGIFVVPLFAMVQTLSDPSQRSRVFAGVNIQNSGYIVLASLSALALTKLGFATPQLFLVLAVVNGLALILWQRRLRATHSQ